MQVQLQDYIDRVQYILNTSVQYACLKASCCYLYKMLIIVKEMKERKHLECVKPIWVHFILRQLRKIDGKFICKSWLRLFVDVYLNLCFLIWAVNSLISFYLSLGFIIFISFIKKYIYIAIYNKKAICFISSHFSFSILISFLHLNTSCPEIST